MTEHDPIPKLPEDTERILFLIREELKLIHIYRAFSLAGLDNPGTRPCLEALIFRDLGVREVSDDFIQHYVSIMEKYSMLTEEATPATFDQRAHWAYEALQALDVG